MVTLEGKLELPTAPAGAKWRSHAFVASVSKGKPVTLPGLTCGRLRKAATSEGVVINAYIDDITMHWHAESRHVEAQLWRAAQQHFTTSALASRLGLHPRLLALNASHTYTGPGTVTVLYRRGTEASDDYLQVLRLLLYENVACHVQGDEAAVVHKFCDLQRSALWPHHAGLDGGELLRLLSPCQDPLAMTDAGRPSAPEPAPTGPSIPFFFTAHHFDRRAATPLGAGPVCEGLQSTKFELVISALMQAKSSSLAAASASSQGQASLPSGKDKRRQRGTSQSGFSGGAGGDSSARSGSSGVAASLTAASCALAMVLGAWSVGCKVARGRASGGLQRVRRAASLEAPKTRGSKPPARASRNSPEPSAKRVGQSSPQPAQPAPSQQQGGLSPTRLPSQRDDIQARDVDQVSAAAAQAAKPAQSKPRDRPQEAQLASVAQAAVPTVPPARRRRTNKPSAATERSAAALALAGPATPAQPAESRAPAAPAPVAPAPPPVAAPEPEAPSAGPPKTAAPAASSGAPDSGSDGGLCLVCLDAPWQHGFLHGGSVHIGVCGECLAAMQAAGRGRGAALSCPVCRSEVERVVALFA